jgi:hypothetical protein
MWNEVTLGDIPLGKSLIDKADREAWPTSVTQPKIILIDMSNSVVNEVYYQRSVAFERAKELLGKSVPYMAYHLGVKPDYTYRKPFGAGVVMLDSNDKVEDPSKGIYYDFMGGGLVVEHVEDSAAQAQLKANKNAKGVDVSPLPHFHVATYSVGGSDAYGKLKLDELQISVTTGEEYSSQSKMLSNYNASNQYLPTYFHTTITMKDLKSILPKAFTPLSQEKDTFVGLRVPSGLPQRRSYDLKAEVGKHHIYYLNFPGSPVACKDGIWQ